MINCLKFSFLVIYLLLFTFCSEKEPIREDTLVLAYTDLMFAQDTLLITKQNVDSLKLQIFKRHNISEKDYLKTIELYTASPNRWENFFDRVIMYVERLKSKPVKNESTSFWPLRFVKVQN